MKTYEKLIKNIPFNFVSKFFFKKFNQIALGLQSDWISTETALDLGKILVESYPLEEQVTFEIEIQYLKSKEEVTEIFYKYQKIGDFSQEQCFDLWAYVLCLWMYEKRDSIEDFFEAISYVYANVNYVEDLEEFIPFMVSREISDSPYESINPRDRLLKNFLIYLENNKQKFIK